MTAQSWDPERYSRQARFVSELGMPVVALLDPQFGERVLDIGCGDGALTEKLVALGCVVVGIDSSPEQVAAARARGLDARVADCRRLDFQDAFEGVFSNAVLHWVQEADAVIGGVARALVPGGRFVGEFGGAGNVARIERALSSELGARGLDPRTVHPWYFPTPEGYSEKLRAGGFTVESIELFPRPTELPGDMVSWLETFGQPFTAGLPEAERRPFLEAVQNRLRPDLCNSAGRWHADYVRLRFKASLVAE